MTGDGSSGVAPRGRLRRHWRRNAAIAFGVLVVLLVGGPFFYIHVIEGKAPAKLSVTTGASLAPGETAIPVDGSWRVTSPSQAGYRVNEVLVGQKTTAVGRTSDVSGSMTVAGTSVTKATFTVQLESVTSDRSQRDDQFRGRIMDVSRYPTASFTLTKAIDLGTVPAPGVTRTFDGTGAFTAHGVTRTVTVPLSARRAGNTIAVSGSIPVIFADYGITNPSFGPVSTDDHGLVEFLLTFASA
jgi:polyisoprenoid-binding protein YceI